MSVVSTAVGLISGINTGEIVDAMINAQRTTAARLEQRQKNFEGAQVGLQALQATLLSIKTSTDTLSKASSFTKLSVASSDESALRATALSGATAGTNVFQPLQRASAHMMKSRGFSSATEAVGAGTITIARGGEVDTSTSLSLLNGGAGVRLGTIRVTDRTGTATDVDLSTARTVTDVLDAINASGGGVTAAAQGDRLVLTDQSGGAGTLAVRDLAGGSTAADLGIASSAAAETLTGSSIFSVTDSFALTQIDDGNAPHFSSAGADLRMTLSDGSQLDIELSGTTNLRGILTAINEHADNGGKLTASLSGGRLVLADTTGGAGSLTVADINGATVTRSLGLDGTPAGSTLTGKALTGGLNTVLLRNLRGGQGITQLGQITLTDRTGAAATIDLSNTESLSEVLTAINAAETAGGQKLAIQATIESTGLGIVLRDTSGATASNLTVADVGGGTVAADLGILIDSAETSVRSGHLGRRYVSEATSLSTYAAGGTAVGTGSFTITDSAGNLGTVTVTNTTKTVGDLIAQINSAGIQVTAKLNDTGDGIVLIDEAGGAGTLSVANLGTAKVATNLKLVGEAVTGGDGIQRIDGRQAVLITLDGDDTLADLEAKLDSANAGLSATIFDDGSAVNPAQLLINATATGSANRLRIDDGGLGLSLSTVVAAQDALLRVGDNASTGVLLSSATNTFKNAPGGLEVEVLKATSQPVEIKLDTDLSTVKSTVAQFVANYNQFFDATAELTKYDPATNARGVLFGDGTVQRTRLRLDSLLSSSYGTGTSVSTLADLGVTFSSTGKLSLDEEKLNRAISDHPAEVQSFFTDKSKGFAVRSSSSIETLTNPLTGTYKLQEDALADSIDRIEKRVAVIDSILDAKRLRLIRQFAKMEEALNSMQSQQNALLQLANLSNRNNK